MAELTFEFLTGRAREALPYLRGAAARGLSASAAIDILKPLNLTFQRQRMLDLYASLLGRTDPERAARLVGQNTPIPQELHFTPPVELNSNYQYVVGAFDAEGNAVGGLTVSSAEPLAANRIRSIAILKFQKQRQLYIDEAKAVVNAVSILEANVNANAPKA